MPLLVITTHSNLTHAHSSQMLLCLRYKLEFPVQVNLWDRKEQTYDVLKKETGMKCCSLVQVNGQGEELRGEERRRDECPFFHH